MKIGVVLSAMAFCLGATGQAGQGYRLETVDGRIVIRDGRGEILPWTGHSAHCTPFVDWQQKTTAFVEAGTRIYQISPDGYWLNPFWPRGGELPEDPGGPVTLGEKAEWLLRQDPKARFIIRFGLWPDPAWRAKHLDEYVPAPWAQNPQMGRKSLNPSLASEAYIRDLRGLIRNVVSWCEKQSWSRAIAGYCAFPVGEGMTEHATKGILFDTSAPMQEAFRQFARERYGSVEELRRAWGDEVPSFETLRVPAMEEWIEKKRRLGILHWPRALLVRRELDYFELQRRLYRRYVGAILDGLNEATAKRPCLTGADIFKQHMQGWLLEPRFFGGWQGDTMEDYGNPLLASGAFGVADYLDHPGLDILQTPGLYPCRAMGYAWEAEGLADSLRLRGKVNIMEADLRTWVKGGVRDPSRLPGTLNFAAMQAWNRGGAGDATEQAGAFLTPGEMEAGFDRALCWALSRNQMFYYMTTSWHDWWFSDPVVARKIAAGNRIVEAWARKPWGETRDAICLVIDDGAGLYEDFSCGYQHVAVARQLEEGLALCGVPYRIHLLEDLAREDFPRYRCYLFPNLFHVSEATRKVFREKLLRDGNLVILGPATGISEGENLGSGSLSDLLGVDMEMIARSFPRRVILQDHGHPLSRRLPTLTFGSDYAFGPALVPRTRRLAAGGPASMLGSLCAYYYLDRPGLFIVDRGKGAQGRDPAQRGEGDYSILFSAAIPLPPEILRECARYAGCHVFSEENAVVYASEGFVGLHVARGGEHRLSLPAGVAAFDVLNNRALPVNDGKVVLESSGPATFLVELLESPPP